MEEKVENQVPNEIHFEDQIFDLQFHPFQNVVAIGLITGRIQVCQYGPENKLLYDTKVLKRACRSLQFSPDGKFLIAGSSDKSLRVMDLDTGQFVFTLPKAHKSPLNVMKTWLDYSLLTGDDDGEIKMWDLRSKSVVATWNDNEDYISDMVICDDKFLLAPSGDGFLSVFNLRKRQLEARSDNTEEDLLSIAVIKDGKKAVVGTQTGVISIWDVGNWGYFNDKFLGHPSSVDSMVVIDESSIATGSSDGLIRLCSIQPNKFIGVIGDHQDFPIERMRLSRDKNLLGSSSHDHTIKFWDISYLYEKDEDQTIEQIEKSQYSINEEKMEIEDQPKRKEKKKKTT